MANSILGLLLCSMCGAQTLRVPDDFPTIREAMAAAAAGATISVAPGTYTEQVRGFSISRNVIKDCSRSGIQAVRSSIVATNNLIIGNRVAGIFCAHQSPSETIIAKNTIGGNHNEAGINVWHGPVDPTPEVPELGCESFAPCM